MEQVKPTIRIGDLLYFPLADAARYINASVHTLRRYVYQRKVKYLEHVKGLMFLQEWLDELIRNMTIEPRKKMR